jgi:hypothetical protein
VRNDVSGAAVLLARILEEQKMKLVDDAKNAGRWISMWCMTIAGAIQGAWIYMPDDMRNSLDPDLVKWATLALLVMGVGGRLVKQGPKA